MPPPFSTTLDFNELIFSEALPHGKLGELKIAGVPFYIEAIDDRGPGREESRTAAHPELQDRIDAVALVDAGGDRPGYATILDKGIYYFVVIYPFQL